MTIKLLAFDADDTLWQNETLYHHAQEKFVELLSGYGLTSGVMEALYQTEIGNLPYFGYGVKSFTLSMIETASHLTQGCISAQDLLNIVQIAKQMLDTPVELLPGVRPVIESLSSQYTLMILTKGDLLDQRRKLTRSGLAPYFKWVEVVTDKTPEMYADLFAAHQIEPESFLMVGNSLRSDILPVVALGARAVYIPFHLTWAHEHDIDHLDVRDGYFEIEQISQLPEILARL
jgi:putative hydrolase of the HAD superfamily